MSTRQRTSTVVVEQPKQKTNEPEFPDIQTIRNAIPAHCFEPSLVTSYYYVFRDFAMVGALVWAALTYIPSIPDPYYRTAAWMVYGFLQGLVCTGIWILGHECGHGAFSKNTKLNNVTGWVLHSFLSVPYFSWKYSHHRHHRFTGHIVKDMAFVPATQPKPSPTNALLASIDELFEDTPIRQTINLIAHQLFGWQVYTFLNASAGKGSKQWEPTGISKWLRVSHFDPFSAVFRPNESLFIFISDVGLAITWSALYYASKFVGGSTVLYLYLVPYLWVHHWLVAITYLHHHHEEVPHYNEEGWTFVKGALATIDRDFGFVGKHIFHGIIEKHVIHHLFPRIPFYKADEATEAVKPLLGDLYHSDERSFLGQLWSNFGTLKYVENDPNCPEDIAATCQQLSEVKSCSSSFIDSFSSNRYIIYNAHGGRSSANMANVSPGRLPFEHIAPKAAHTHTVVFLHGRKDNARKFAESLEYSPDSNGRTLFDTFPSFRWVFPQAPVRKVASTGETWPQWFDVWNVRDFAENEELQSIGLKEVVPEIRDLLASEAATLGGRWDRVVLAGISMGAATSVHTLFNLDVPVAGGGKLAAFLGFSCRCPFTGRSLAGMREVLALDNVPGHADVVRNTPMLLEHCIDDPLVLLQNGQNQRDTLRGFGATVEWKEYPNGGHWFNSPRGMDDAIDFLSKHVLAISDSAASSLNQSHATDDSMDLL
ncbi:Oleate hydroxylase FAH12 [Paramyrothecium foliicola]|nr:Oleate hydroxylase FAH12 [Paramyrothecium foliicola]